MKNKENEGVIILFGQKAKAIVVGKYRLLNLNDIDKDIVGNNTNFYNAFKEAEKFIKNKNEFMNKRILFLTDGESDSSQLKDICNNMKRENFQINIVGFENKKNNKIFSLFTLSKINNSIVHPYSQYKNIPVIKRESSFEHLKKFASPNCFYTSENFEEVEIICQNIFAAE